MNTNKTKPATAWAVCEFYKSGNVFPVEISIPTEARAGQLCQWMKTGAGQWEDWRVITMAELCTLLEAGKVELTCFTAEAQAERKTAILTHAN